MKERNFNRIASSMMPGWGSLANYGFDPAGRIWVLWNPTAVSVSLIGSSSQVLHCLVKVLSTSVECLISFIYASNSSEERHLLWNELRQFATCSKPWVLLGDFNNIRSSGDKSGGSTLPYDDMDDFNSCLSTAGLDDIPYTGQHFTWCNQRLDEARIYCKLDRILANDAWFLGIRSFSAYFHSAGISDHSLGILFLGEKRANVKTPFRFFDYWADHDNFLPSVAAAWNKAVSGTPMFVLASKLKETKVALKRFNKIHFSSLSSRVSMARDQLVSSQTLLSCDKDNRVFQLVERNRYAHFMQLKLQEEQFFRQRSRVNWVKHGDQNTSFFFRMMKRNHARANIHSLINDQHEVVTNPDHIQNLFLDHFQKLLGSSTPSEIDVNFFVSRLISNRINQSHSDLLGKEVSAEEITKVMFSLKNGKAPGPGGFSAGFFKKAWGIVGDDVVKAISSFFRDSRILKQLNNTSIALIPKVLNPSHVSEFRPISCCNTIYKCISRILAGRLKDVLSGLISKSQTAFVPGRRIADNIFLSQELLRGYHLQRGTPRCAIKVDLMKAYDNVRWDCIIAILRSMGFPDIFVRWVFECISTPSYSININGEIGRAHV